MAIDRPRAARAVEELLAALGRDPRAEPELAGTGARVADALADDLLAGYATDARALLRDATLATRAAEGTVVELVGYPVVTVCPHHLLPARGTADVAFEARGALVGIGALGQAVDACARRLTLQETLGADVADAVQEALAPAWVRVRLDLEHGCMVLRGERATGARVVTTTTRGAAKAGGAP